MSEKYDDEFTIKLTKWSIRIVAICLNSAMVLTAIGFSMLVAIFIIWVLNWAIMNTFG